MRAEFWALLTAVCWAVGSLLEKRGMKAGGLSPAAGVAVRTAFSLVLLSFLSYPFWGQLKTAGAKSILLIAAGGGVLAGGLGIVFLYAGLRSGNIATVMTVAFCLAPVFGTILGYFVLHERLSAVQTAGIVLCIAGAFLTVYFRGR